MRKIFVLLAFSIFLAGMAFAPSKTPSHPLSHIHPMDVDLNMSGRDIFNVTELRLGGPSGGIKIDNESIYDEGNNQVLLWDAANNEWVVKNADLNLSDNQLKGVGSTECNNNEFIAGDGSCKTPSDVSSSDTLNQTLIAGDIANQSIRFNDNDVTNPGNITDFFATACESDEMVRRVYSNGSYVCTPVSSASTTEDLSQTLGEGNTAGSYNINMTGNNITDVGEIQDFFANTCSGSNEVVKKVYANGSYVCQTVPEDEGVESLNATLEAGSIANQSIYMNNNDLVGVRNITMPNGVIVGQSALINSTDSVAIGDGTGAVDLAANAGGLVAVGGGANASDKYSVAIGKDSVSKGGSGSVALGPDSEANGYESVALGFRASATDDNAIAISDADASGLRAVAIGDSASASGSFGVAIGLSASQSGGNSVALGRSANAAGEKSVAIGYHAVSPNNYEATFGNLSGAELDLNVTGNLTVHGQFIDAKNGEIRNTVSNSLGDAVNRSYVLNASGVGSDDQTLSEVLSSGNDADNNNINMSWNEVRHVVSNSAGDAVNRSFVLNNGSVGTDNQDLFETVSADGTSLVADSPTDTVTLQPGSDTSGISIGGDSSTDTASFSVDWEDANDLYSNGNVTWESAAGLDANGNLAPAQNLDMGDREVQNVVSNSGGDAVNRSFVLSNNSIGSDDQTLSEVLSQGSDAENNINMTFDDLTQVGNITGFFADTCSNSNEVVKKVYANGSYVCQTVPEDEGVESLNATLEAGNEANQTIDMMGNNIDRIGTLNSGDEDIVVGGALNMTESNIYASSGNWLNIQGGDSSGTVNGVAIEDSEGQNIILARPDGEVEISNGQLVMDSGKINMSGNRITDIGSVGGTNFDSSGNLDMADNNIDDVSSVDGNGDAVDVNDNLDMNGNSVTTSSGEVCIGDQCT